MYILAISKDNSIYKLCHQDTKRENGKELRAGRMAKFAEEKFGLTASVGDNFDDNNSSVHPCAIKFSESDESNDADLLLKACQIHHCSGYCMRHASHSKE